MSEYEKAPQSPTPNSAKGNSILKGDIEIQSPIAEVRFQDEKIVDDAYGRSTPTRKYSVRWWKRTWDGAIRIGTWPRLLYCGIGLVLLVVWIGVMLSLVGAEVTYEKKNLQGSVRTNNYGGSALDYIMLKGSLVNFDVDKRTLAVSWSGLYGPNNSTDPVEFADSANPASPKFPDGIEIYRDVSSVLYNATYFDDVENVTSSVWAYQVDNRTAKHIGVIGVHSWDSFDTDIQFTQRYARNAWLQPLLGYPFDQWHGEIVFVANNVFVSKFFNLNSSGVMEIGGIQLADSTLNWRFSFEFTNTCSGDDPNAIIDYTNITSLPPFCHTKIEFDGSRPPLLIFCAVAAVVVNWTCALFIFILTCEAIIMRRSYMLEGTDILSMCFTALFALPTIRSLLPGAPSYGAIIDLVGILPCTLIVALCAVCVAVAKLNKRHKPQKEE
ncbi:hypothetical protein FRB91_000824 [Serendipita sp. 411]|nr:hypothetical protein FRB91_000824 [Serendipita sp. 411]